MSTNYLDKVVYQRRGTRTIVAETEANKSDPNLVPLTVGEAIQLGLVPGYSEHSESTGSIEDSEKEALRNQISELTKVNTDLTGQLQNLAAQFEQLKNDVQASSTNISEPPQELSNNDDGHDDIESQLKELQV